MGGTRVGPSGDVSRAGDVVRLRQVDVFTDTPMSGNGLAVVQSTVPLEPSVMLAITRELRQFETIFLTGVDRHGATARIFTEQEELAFAGHPVLGASAVLHWEQRADSEVADWRVVVAGRALTVRTRRRPSNDVIDADMDQGPATTLRTLSAAQTRQFAAALGVEQEQLRDDLPCQVVTTGLPYLLLPVTGRGLSGSRVTVPDLTERLRGVGADFVYVLDPEVPEGRTWDNSGATEDVATGSAAGPVGDFLITHGIRGEAEPFDLHQGRHVGRPSLIRVRRGQAGSMWVGGPVVPFAEGALSRVVR
ncbi:MAG: PhzF family phenazine biosynthesis protein [Actinomycetes bacterium]